MPPPLLRKATKATLLKMFILDEHGGYTGEYVVDNECVIEYGDFLRVVPDEGLADQESVYLGEYIATALHGNRLSLVAVSKGPLTLEDLTWPKAALTVTEAHLTSAEGSRTPGTEPDRAVIESLMSALEKREADLLAREKALQEMIERMRREAEEARKSLVAELNALRAHVAELEVKRTEERKQLEAENERLRQDVAQLQRPASSAESPSPDQTQFEQDQKMLQHRAVDLLDREERLRSREAELAAEAEGLDAIRKENEAVLAKLEVAKKSAPTDLDTQADRREIDTRVKILQRKALDLLDREEALRKREEDLRKVVGG